MGEQGVSDGELWEHASNPSAYVHVSLTSHFVKRGVDILEENKHLCGFSTGRPRRKA